MGSLDCMCQFHVVAVFITSQLTESHFTETFSALKRIYATVICGQVAVKYAMTDADGALLNAHKPFWDGPACTIDGLLSRRSKGVRTLEWTSTGTRYTCPARPW